jgi:hypothetical protein
VNISLGMAKVSGSYFIHLDEASHKKLGLFKGFWHFIQQQNFIKNLLIKVSKMCLLSCLRWEITIFLQFIAFLISFNLDSRVVERDFSWNDFIFIKKVFSLTFNIPNCFCDFIHKRFGLICDQDQTKLYPKFKITF